MKDQWKDVNESELGAVISRIYPNLFRKAKWIIKDHSLAEDTVQEAILVAITRIQTLKEPEKIEQWLYTIVTNTAKNAYNKRKRSGEMMVLDNMLEEQSAQNPKPIGDLIQKMLGHEHFIYLVGKLKPEYKQVIMLRYFNELSLKEIASELKISLSAVKSRLTRAITRLRAMFIEELPETL